MSKADLSKQPAQVAAMFDEVSTHYDRTNTVLSMGNAALWRAATTRAVAPRPGETILDVAAGTGTSSASLARNGASVVAADFSEGMIEVGRRRQADNPFISFVQADATALPFEDDTFDAVTISFGLRNIVDPRKALAEFHRVTKPGGRVVICEFSHPVNGVIRTGYDAYLKYGMPLLARLSSSNPAAYEYLMDSIQAWPDQPTLADWLREAGFEGVQYRNLTAGIVALHRGRKPVGAAVAGVTAEAAKSRAEKPAAVADGGEKVAAGRKPATAKPAGEKPVAAKEPATAKSATVTSAGEKPAAAKKPATAKPAGAKPATGKTATAKPAAAKPTAAAAAATKPATAKAAVAKPAATKPTSPKSTAAKPPAAKPAAASKPAPAKSAAAKSTAATSTAAKSTSAKPAAAKPATTAKPAATTSTTAKPATTRSTTAKPTPAKPATAKSTTAKPATAKSTTAKAAPSKSAAKPATAKRAGATSSATTSSATTDSATTDPTTAKPAASKPGTAGGASSSAVPPEGE